MHKERGRAEGMDDGRRVQQERAESGRSVRLGRRGKAGAVYTAGSIKNFLQGFAFLSPAPPAQQTTTRTLSVTFYDIQLAHSVRPLLAVAHVATTS